MATSTNDSTSAGPAPRCEDPPAAAEPTVEKMPAPMMAPMPSDVSCTQPSARLSCVCGCPVSDTSASSDFRRKSCMRNESRATGRAGAVLILVEAVRGLVRRDDELAPQTARDAQVTCHNLVRSVAADAINGPLEAARDVQMVIGSHGHRRRVHDAGGERFARTLRRDTEDGDGRLLAARSAVGHIQVPLA